MVIIQETFDKYYCQTINFAEVNISAFSTDLVVLSLLQPANQTKAMEIWMVEVCNKTATWMSLCHDWDDVSVHMACKQSLRDICGRK